MKKDLIKGTTESGFEFEIDRNALDDYELIEMISQLDDGNTKNLPIIYEKILGTEQKRALIEHLRKDGKTSFTDMSLAFFDIMNAIKEGKKS